MRTGLGRWARGGLGDRTFMPRTDVPVTIGRLVCWRAGASAAVAPGYNNMMQKTRSALILPSTYFAVYDFRRLEPAF